MSDYYFNTQLKSTNVRVDGWVPKATNLLFRFLWRWAPGFTRWLTLRLFFSPAAYHAGEEEKDCLRKGRRFQIRVHDKVVSAWKWGRGPAVLLIHGWSGRGIQFHRFVEPLVNAGYTAIALDMPAHGDSSGRITSYFEFTDTLRLMLSKAQGLKVRGIIAHSFGAAAAINALVKEEIALNAVCIAPILRLRELLLNTFERLGVPEAIYTTLIRQFEKQFGYRLETDNPQHLIGGLRGRILLVHDENDRTVAFSDSAHQAQQHAHLSLSATQGLGHRRILADETVVQACIEHLGPPMTDQIMTHNVNTGDKMRPVNSLLETYAEADPAQRLSMYLTYRDLRGQFNQIDLTQGERSQWAPSPPKGALRGWRRWPGFAALCCGWLRHGRLTK